MSLQKLNVMILPDENKGIKLNVINLMQIVK